MVLFPVLKYNIFRPNENYKGLAMIRVLPYVLYYSSDKKLKCKRNFS